MDLATVVGFVGGFVIVGAAIVTGGDPVIFVNIPSILIVVLGSVFVVSMKFSIADLKSAVSVAMKAFIFKIAPPEEVISKIVELAKLARRDGPLALENVKVDNPFLTRGIQLIVDAAEAEVSKTILARERSATFSRHENGQNIFMAINDVAPAMGMIGTLVGLVQMLANMSDPKSIGPAMAVALLTTLYGAILSNMVAKPIAEKLALRAAEEDMQNAMIIDAVLGMANGLSPTMIEETLVSYLPTNQRNIGGDEAKAA